MAKTTKGFQNGNKQTNNNMGGGTTTFGNQSRFQITPNSKAVSSRKGLANKNTEK